jgi:hypothetical protein
VFISVVRWNDDVLPRQTRGAQRDVADKSTKMSVLRKVAIAVLGSLAGLWLIVVAAISMYPKWLDYRYCDVPSWSGPRSESAERQEVVILQNRIPTIARDNGARALAGAHAIQTVKVERNSLQVVVSKALWESLNQSQRSGFLVALDDEFLHIHKSRNPKAECTKTAVHYESGIKLDEIRSGVFD